MSFRPRIVGRKKCGALFTHRAKYNNLKFFLSSVPVLGVIFITVVRRRGLCKKSIVSVPTLGIIFYLIYQKQYEDTHNTVWFPSPYWGLFFYRQIWCVRK